MTDITDLADDRAGPALPPRPALGAAAPAAILPARGLLQLLDPGAP